MNRGTSRALIFLLIRFEKTIHSAVEGVDIGRVDVVSTHAICSLVAKLDMVLANFRRIGSLSNPSMAVDLVVANGHPIVEKDCARGGWCTRGRARRVDDGNGAGNTVDALVLFTFVGI